MVLNGFDKSSGCTAAIAVFMAYQGDFTGGLISGKRADLNTRVRMGVDGHLWQKGDAETKCNHFLNRSDLCALADDIGAEAVVEAEVFNLLSGAMDILQ